MSNTAQQLIRSVPPELKRAIADRVEQDETNMNDLIVGILAERYSVRFDPTGRAGGEIGGSSDIVLRLPLALKRKIAVDAARRQIEIRAIVIDAIADELGVTAAA